MIAPDTNATGTGELEQGHIEERANELAHAAGREQFDENDLAAAQKELLGTSSPESAALPTSSDDETSAAP